MTAIRFEQWRAFSRDERLKISAAYLLEFRRSDVRAALQNNQHQAAAVDRLEAALVPMIAGDVLPVTWDIETCRAKLATPIPLLIPTNLASYWFFLTRERQKHVTDRLIAALRKVGVNISTVAELARVGMVTP